MSANLFDVLNRMNTEHEGSVHAYFSNNIESVHAGKKGWGNMRIAITTEDAQALMGGIMSGHMTRSVMLFVVDRELMEQFRDET